MRRVVEALVAIERAARDIERTRANPNWARLDQWTLDQRLRDAQQELERALGLPVVRASEHQRP